MGESTNFSVGTYHFLVIAGRKVSTIPFPVHVIFKDICMQEVGDSVNKDVCF
jgi:hypothetical protein